jgi:uncharacterized protein
MRVHLDAVKDSGLHLAYEFDPAKDEGLATVEESGEAVFLTPVAVTLDLNRVADTVEVRGHLSARLRLTCARCLADLDQDVAGDFLCAFAPRPPERRHPTPGDLELNAEDMGLLFFDGQVIETDEAVREEVIAAIPYRALCREDCRGLCPHCGTNLNTGTCTCESNRIDPRLADLSSLNVSNDA